MNSGFWKAKSGKTSSRKKGTFQICPNLSSAMRLWEKSAWACSPHWSPFLLLELSDKRRGWTLPFNEILSREFLFHILLIQALRWSLSLNLPLGQMGKWCSFQPRKAGSILLQGKKKKVLHGLESWRFTEGLHLEISDTEIGYYIPTLSRGHAFCFLRGCFLKVCHNLTYNFIVYEGLSCMLIHLWDLVCLWLPSIL